MSIILRGPIALILASALTTASGRSIFLGGGHSTPSSPLLFDSPLFGDSDRSPPNHAPNRAPDDAPAYFPHASAQDWPSKGTFLKLVTAVEDAATALGHRHYFNGFAPSRIEPEGQVGTDEFWLVGGPVAGGGTRTTMLWPQGYAEHYIGKYNVMPTQNFFDQIVAAQKVGELFVAQTRRRSRSSYDISRFLRVPQG